MLVRAVTWPDHAEDWQLHCCGAAASRAQVRPIAGMENQGKEYQMEDLGGPNVDGFGDSGGSEIDIVDCGPFAVEKARIWEPVGAG